MKRTIILLLVFVLVFTAILAGCGSKSSDIANSESPNNVANEPDDQKADNQEPDPFLCWLMYSPMMKCITSF